MFKEISVSSLNILVFGFINALSSELFHHRMALRSWGEGFISSAVLPARSETTREGVFFAT
jgi:hypothetical protein